LKIVASIETTLDASQQNARSMAASKGWRLDGSITPYVRVRVRVHADEHTAAGMGVGRRGAGFCFCVLRSYSFFAQAIETAREIFRLSANSGLAPSLSGVGVSRESAVAAVLLRVPGLSRSRRSNDPSNE